ncbi:FAD-dependent oxidoreductase [Bacillus testis]|uniref:FAD-dependent oxidoreductase n=1 Tax=Bacillus testis TaxID=1622072 RepID=UPI000A560E7F|nr:FAD-dependent oxidoreductase [Bacillus testis]
MHVDVLIVGGGLGGCAAAMAVCSKGLSAMIVEETDWVGGQSSAQAVPPDEHPWIEEFGCTARYREYRNRIRSYYTRNFPAVKNEKQLNPGKGIVSLLCHDPRVTVSVLEEMLFPYLISGKLTLCLESEVEKVNRSEKKLLDAIIKHTVTQQRDSVTFTYMIDSTDTGEVLALSGTDYITGSESQTETGEPHATEESEPLNIQAHTHVLAMEYRPGEENIIPEPDMYPFWKEYKIDFWPDQMLSFYSPHPITLQKRQYEMFVHQDFFPLWNYRRIFAAEQFQLEDAGDISLLNWPQNDYVLGNVYDVTNEEKKKHLYQAKQLSLSLFYWLQTEAPRPDGGFGYPGLTLRGDVLGTKDGLAKSIYIRESRRIKAQYTITEMDVSPEFQRGKTGKVYRDSVGVGSYSIDLHPSLNGRNYLDIPALPFHIPLGALLPKHTGNLLAGGKNIGTTHITNGCYRLHPVEWNIGEACGALAAFCILNDQTPFAVWKDDRILKDFQREIIKDGFQIQWPSEFYQ